MTRRAINPTALSAIAAGALYFGWALLAVVLETEFERTTLLVMGVVVALGHVLSGTYLGFLVLREVGVLNAIAVKIKTWRK